MHQVEPGGTCPEAGGCDSCPGRAYCACLRVSLGLTDIESEFEGEPIFDIEVVDSSTPFGEENASS